MARMTNAGKSIMAVVREKAQSNEFYANMWESIIAKPLSEARRIFNTMGQEYGDSEGMLEAFDAVAA